MEMFEPDSRPIPGELVLETSDAVGKYEALQLAVQLMAGREFETQEGDQSVFDLVDVAIKCAERFLEWIDEE